MSLHHFEWKLQEPVNDAPLFPFLPVPVTSNAGGDAPSPLKRLKSSEHEDNRETKTNPWCFKPRDLGLSFPAF